MPARWAIRFLLVVLLVLPGLAARAAPYAALVMDARTGEVFLARNADTRLHPASLTKMMTLYIAFEAIKNGEITLDTKVRISRKAAAEPPSKLGLKAGQRVALRYLIRAAAVKSANDAATAIAEAIEGSVPRFARRMNRTARAIGMTRTTFRNANGLTREGHLSTARDMAILGRQLLHDYPQYYNLFSRLKTDAGGKVVQNTNRRFLSGYRGADGIKTGYTAAAGFNLVASARRGPVRIIAVVMGGRSVTMRNRKAAELLDYGFRRAPRKVVSRPPLPPTYARPKPPPVVTAVLKSPRPRPRPVVPPALIAQAIAAEEATETAVATAPRPVLRDDGLRMITRMSTSGGRNWAIDLGAYDTRDQAERLLLKTALRDLASLDGALRKVVPRGGKYRAHFVGLTEPLARRACSRLALSNLTCRPVGPRG